MAQYNQSQQNYMIQNMLRNGQLPPGYPQVNMNGYTTQNGQNGSSHSSGSTNGSSSNGHHRRQ